MPARCEPSTTNALRPVALRTGRVEQTFKEALGARSCVFNTARPSAPVRQHTAERLAQGDPRPSLEERYGEHDGYVEAVRAATRQLLREGFLIDEDADRYIAQPEDSNVLRRSKDSSTRWMA